MRSRAEQKAQRPGEILEAAFHEFSAKGYEGARLDVIAARVGMTKGAVYFYFASKEALFTATVRHMSGELAAVSAACAALSGTPAERLEGLIRTVHNAVTSDARAREGLRLLIANNPRFPGLSDLFFTDFAKPLLVQCGTILAEGAASGAFHASAATLMPEVVMDPIFATMVSMLLNGDTRRGDPARYVTAHVGLVLAGLRR